MKRLIHKLAAAGLFPEYSLYRIYEMPSGVPQPPGDSVRPAGAELFAAHSSPELRELAPYAGDGAHGFGAFTAEGELGSGCWFWTGRRLARRGWGSLPPDATELVQINTASGFRGRGLAVSLIRHGGSRMRELGFRRVFARVWHSNEASVRAFTKAEWSYTSFFIALGPLHLIFPRRGLPRRTVFE